MMERAEEEEANAAAAANNVVDEGANPDADDELEMYNVEFLESSVVANPGVATAYLAGLYLDNNSHNARNHRRSMLVCNSLPVDWEEIEGETMRVPLSIRLHLMRVVYGEERGCNFLTVSWNLLRSFRDYTWRCLERNHSGGFDSGQQQLSHGSIADDVDLELFHNALTEYESAFDADVEWHPLSNVTNQYRSVTSMGASTSSSVNSGVLYTPVVRNLNRLCNKTSYVVNREYNMIRSWACVCDYVNVYRSVKRVHCDTDKYKLNCDCFRKVCKSLHRVVCLRVLEELDKIRKSYRLYTQNYCGKHRRWISLEPETDYYDLVMVYGLKCTEIMPGMCFHDGISLLQSSRFNTTMFGSDLHVSMCNYMFYMFGRSDGRNRVAPTAQLDEAGVPTSLTVVRGQGLRF